MTHPNIKIVRPPPGVLAAPKPAAREPKPAVRKDDEAPPFAARPRHEPYQEPLDLDRFERMDRPVPSLFGPVREMPEPVWAKERSRRKWPLVIPLAALALFAATWLKGSPPEPTFRADQIDPPAAAAATADTAGPLAHDEQAAHEEPAAHEQQPGPQGAGAADRGTIPVPPPLPAASAAITEPQTSPPPPQPAPPPQPSPSPQLPTTAEVPSPPVAKPDVAKPEAAPPPVPSRRHAAPITASREPPVRHLPPRAKDGPPIDAADLPPLDPAGTPPSDAPASPSTEVQ